MRDPRVFASLVNAGMTILWTGDTHYGSELNWETGSHIDIVAVVSEWNKDCLSRFYPFLARKIYVTNNAIEPKYFCPGTKIERNPHRAIYSSSIERGLELLVEWWPKVRECIPDAELVYCQAPVYNQRADTLAEYAYLRNELSELTAATDGIRDLGSLSQPALAMEMLKSQVWLAPSWMTLRHCHFYETFCIGSVEAAAAGCRRIMSPWGALTERTEAKAEFIAGSPEPPREKWVEAISSALVDESPLLPSTTALLITWHSVVDDLLNEVQAHMEKV